VIDGAGDLAIFSVASNGTGMSYVRGDGLGAVFLGSGLDELQLTTAPRPAGFATVSHVFTPSCNFGRLMDPDATSGVAIPIDGPYPSFVDLLMVNPGGGYVEERTTLGMPNVLDLRWVDEGLNPLGDWHTAVTWPGATENPWLIAVDQLGRALVLSFIFPASLGAPPPPQAWTFTAQWMDANGTVGEAFVPIAPVYTAPNGTQLFADWDTMRPLRGGGFAMYHGPNSGPGTLSQQGWYAFYPSGQAAIEMPPVWLKAFDGTLQLVAGGAAYAALRRDPQTCARTLLLVGDSGTPCYSLTVSGSEFCIADRLQPDGTLLLQAGCAVRWWPQLARLASP
jgi:hypothetical protein